MILTKKKFRNTLLNSKIHAKMFSASYNKTLEIYFFE